MDKQRFQAVMGLMGKDGGQGGGKRENICKTKFDRCDTGGLVWRLKVVFSCVGLAQPTHLNQPP